MNDPSNVELIEIEVPNSAKYARNQFKIITSKSANIPPKLKKTFKANIDVHYPFGRCSFTGRVRQNGDWKDHVRLANDKVVASIDVKLKNGNLLKAVRFKLLLPETRGGANEILAALILKQLGLISPETFHTKGHRERRNYRYVISGECRERIVGK